MNIIFLIFGRCQIFYHSETQPILVGFEMNIQVNSHECYAYQIGTSVCRVVIEQSLQTASRRVEKITCSEE